MHRFALAVLLAAACGGSGGNDPAAPGEGGPPGAFVGGGGGGDGDGDGHGDGEPAGEPGSPPEPGGDDGGGNPDKPRPASDEPSGDMAGIVGAHNAVRARHCAPPLRWSPKIARVAQKWADDLARRGCAFEHSAGMDYGENLTYISPPGMRGPADVVDGWYSEVAGYNFKSGKFSFETGHFTQLVWVDTSELGCGRAVCQDAEIWVCNYASPGNVQGMFRANVLPESCRK